MVLSSGPVSLNIHEALTFDGTEICLHPDLFLVTNHNYNVTTSGGHLAMNQNSNNTTTANATTIPGAGVSSALKNVNKNKNATITTTTKPTAGAHSRSSILSVGDMIEIRVWDPITRSTGTTEGITTSSKAASSVMRRRTTNASIASNSVPSIQLNKSASTTDTPTSFIVSTAADTTATSTAMNNVSSNNKQEQSNNTNNTSFHSDNVDTSTATTMNRNRTDTGNTLNSLQYSGSSSPKLGGEMILQEVETPTIQETRSKDSVLSTASTTTAANEDTAIVHPTSVSKSLTTTPSGSPMTSKPIFDPLSMSDNTGMIKNDNGFLSTISSSVLPPVFPRGRTSTMEVGQSTNAGGGTSSGGVTTRLVSKRPAMIQRRSTVHSTIPTTNTSSTTTTSSSNAITITPAVTAEPPKTSTTTNTNTNTNTTRHYRDLSDMTAETLNGVSTGIGNIGLSSNEPNTSDIVVDFPIQNNVSDGKECIGGAGGSLSVSGGGGPPVFGTTGTLMNNYDNDFDDDDGFTYLYNTHKLRLSFVMLVSETTLTSIKSTARTRVSILRQVADLYHLSSYDTITVSKIEKIDKDIVLREVSADFVLVTIKDQFISRGDMHYFQNSLIGSWIYEGQRLYESNRGIQAIARAIRNGDKQTRSGIVTDKTTVTFRSRSARIFWLVQMSSEMWDYASPYERGKTEEGLCEIYFDKWISFVYELFTKWKELEATHSLTVAFFSRTYRYDGPILSKSTVGSISSSTSSFSKDNNSKRDAYGRNYEDHFRLVIENLTGPDWESFVLSLKKAFVSYPMEVGWNLATDCTARHPSNANQGNVLEAINVTLNLLQFHYFDRDLHRTGNSIVLISAGNGVFEVDQGLAGITYQRMMDNGIGSDMLSLSLPALHIAPFFLYNTIHDMANMEDLDSQEQYYEVPHWMHLSFVAYESDNTVFANDRDDGVDIDHKPITNPADGLDIRANGFLLPRNITTRTSEPEAPPSPGFRPISMSIRGNASIALPEAKKAPSLSSERQLIAGRDFRDILEACRPKNARSMPSPLKAVISFCSYGSHDERDCTESIGDGKIGQADCGIAGNDQNSRVPEIQQSLLLDKKDALKSPNPSGIVLSQIPDSILGSSYDHPVAGTYPSSLQSGFQLQRPAPLRCDIIEDRDADSDSDTVVSYTNSSDDEFGSDKLTYQDKLRLMMEAHDTAYAQLPVPKLMLQVEPRIPNPIVASRMEPRSNMDFSTAATRLTASGRIKNSLGTSRGGMEAALQQHSVNPVPGGASVRVEGSNSSMSAHRSFGKSSDTSAFRFSSDASLNYRRMSEAALKPFSPMLLPPAIAANVPDFLPPDIRRPLDRRLINTQDLSVRVSSETVTWKSNDSGGMLSGSLIMDSRSEGQKRSKGDSRSLSLSPPTDRPQNAVAAAQVDRPHGKVERKHRSKLNKKVFNPFRQQDEDEVLAMKTHNRRRWSHVFPLGEIEFKRHAGPNWRSLCAPAILPLSIDYFPTQDEVDQNFTFSIYNVTLSEFERKNFSSSIELLMEMVRQRITQDFQLVSEDNVNASNFRPRTLRNNISGINQDRAMPNGSNVDTVRQFLSMGHRLQVITYDPSCDIVEVTRYNAKNAQENNALNTFKYQYYTYCRETRRYDQVVQTFSKYADQYNWNKFDRIMCGDEDRELREGMRFRRLMFGVIPDKFTDQAGELEYIAKFRRLIDYLNKLRDKDESQAPLDIKFVCLFDNNNQNTFRNKNGMESTPGIAHNSMQRFYVQLRKGTRDAMEWIEVVVDSTFNTSWSYRIILNWLVASSGKVDTQVQLLQRRCNQYGLNLIPFPQVTVSRSLYLNPFKAPAIFCIRSKDKSAILDSALAGIDFLHDGIFYTDVNAILECIENRSDYHSPSIGAACRQFVHRSGTLFVRIFTDRNGLSLMVVLGNYRYLFLSNKEDNSLEITYRNAFDDLRHCVESLGLDERASGPS